MRINLYYIAAAMIVMAGLQQTVMAQIPGRISVQGVAMNEGKPVQGALVYFSPKMTGKSAEVGKPGFAVTDEAGRFILTTYGTQDGAVVGQHVVRVTTGKEFPCDCVGEETRDLMDVEIVADKENEFKVELPKRTAPVQKNPFDDVEEKK